MIEPEKAVAALERLAKASAQPPAPISLDAVRSDGGVIGVMHWIRAQNTNSVALIGSNPYGYPSPIDVAKAARELDDPLHTLARALEEMASECRQRGVVPVGINITTEHYPDPESYVRNRHAERAVFSIDVTVVSRSWVIQTMNRAEQAENPTDAAPAEEAQAQQ